MACMLRRPASRSVSVGFGKKAALSASHARSVDTDPAYEPKHDKDDQNNPQDAAEPRGPIATVRIVPTSPAENQNQQDDEKNSANASTSPTAAGPRIGTSRRHFEPTFCDRRDRGL